MGSDLSSSPTRFVTQKSTGDLLVRCPHCRGYHKPDKNGEIDSHKNLIPESDDIDDPVLAYPKIVNQIQKQPLEG